MFRAAGKVGTTAWSALALAFLAVALRVLVPGGYMIAAPGEAAGVPIILCTERGVETVLLGADARLADPSSGSQDDHSGKPAPDHPCAFAGLGAALAPADVLTVGLAAWTHAADGPAFPPEIRPGRGMAAPPPPQTGPPLLI